VNRDHVVRGTVGVRFEQHYLNRVHLTPMSAEHVPNRDFATVPPGCRRLPGSPVLKIAQGGV
jgi:hypothetical protein